MDDDGVIRDVPLTIAVRIWTTADGELHVDLAGLGRAVARRHQRPVGLVARRRLLRRPGLLRLGGAAERRAHPPRAPALRGGRPAAAAVPGRRLDPPHRGAAPHRRGGRGARRPAARPRGGRGARLVPDLRDPGDRSAQRPRHDHDRHPRRGRWRPAGRAGRRGDRLVHLQLRAAAGRDRRAGVPVADRAHRAGRGLGRRRSRTRVVPACCATTRCSPRTATASTTSSRRTRRSRPAGATAAGPAHRARSCCGAPAPTCSSSCPARARCGCDRRHAAAAGRRRRRLRRCLSSGRPSGRPDGGAHALAQLELLDLAGRRLRDLAEDDRLRRLEAGQPLAAERDQLGLGGARRRAAARRTRTAPRPSARRASRRPPPRPPPGAGRARPRPRPTTRSRRRR